MSPKMQRREFITLLGGAAAAWPLAVRAQQPDRVRLSGVLVGNEQSEVTQSWLAAFLGALSKLGWTEGSDLRIELRWSAGDAPLECFQAGRNRAILSERSANLSHAM
jgi:putative ABC transport system substrate-binding protein